MKIRLGKRRTAACLGDSGFFPLVPSLDRSTEIKTEIKTRKPEFASVFLHSMTFKKHKSMLIWSIASFP